MQPEVIPEELPTFDIDNGLVRVRELLRALGRELRRLEPKDLEFLSYDLEQIAEMAKDLSDQTNAVSRAYSTGKTARRGCIVAKMVLKWGPYLYRVTKSGGKQTWKYLGKQGSAKAASAMGVHE